MTSRLTGWLVLLVLFPLLAGCSRGWSEISGTVRYQGKPLPKGTITFYDEANQPVTSPIDADGIYAVRKVVAGKVKVTVMLPMFIAMVGDKKGMARMAAERKTLPIVIDPTSVLGPIPWCQATLHGSICNSA